MKKLYEFTIKRTQIVQETEKKQGENGEEISITKPVSKELECKFYIKKPTRVLQDDAELFFAQQYSKYVKMGLLTRAQLAVKFADDGDILAKTEKEKLGEKIKELNDVRTEIEKILITKETERTEEEKIKLNDLWGKYINNTTLLQRFQNEQDTIYDCTADNKARDRVILWWLFELSFNDDNTPFFGTGDFDSKLKKYDAFEDSEDKFQLKVAQRFMHLISYWYSGRATNKEEFDSLFDILEKEEAKLANG